MPYLQTTKSITYYLNIAEDDYYFVKKPDNKMAKKGLFYRWFLVVLLYKILI